MARRGDLFRYLSCHAALSVALCAIPVAAQVTPNVLPSRPQAEPPIPPASPEAPAATARVDDDTAGDDAACPLAGSAVRVTLTGVAFEAPGGGAVPPAIAATLAGIRAPEGADQSIAVVCAVRDAANAALRDAGYVASVQIPAQEIATGVLRLVVISARLSEIRIIGDAGGFRDVIAARAEALKAIDPLNRFEAERQLLLAGKVPGLKMLLTLKPAGRAPGEVIGELKVDAQSFQLIANAQNYGSRQLGREIVSLRAEYYGLTGLADRTYLALSNSVQFDETHVVQVGHDMGVGDSGLRVGVRGTWALSNPDIENLDLRSNSVIAGLDVSYPLLTTLRKELQVAGGFELLNQRTVIRQGSSETPFTRDRLRVLFARIDGTARALDDRGALVWAADAFVQVRKGIGIFGASERFIATDNFQPSRFDGDPQALVISGQLTQTWRPVDLFTIEASAYGQWANNSLLNFEEFSLGNLTYGRGYDPGSNGADRVIAGRIEPRLRLPFAGDDFAVEVTGFFDWVRLYNLDPGTQETGRTLKSAGGGLRLTLPNKAVLDVTYAKPLDFALTTDRQKPRDRVLVSLTMKLLPWGTRQ